MQELGMNINIINLSFFQQMGITLFIAFFLMILYMAIKYLTHLPNHISAIEEQIKIIDLKLEEVRNKL